MGRPLCLATLTLASTLLAAASAGEIKVMSSGAVAAADQTKPKSQRIERELQTIDGRWKLVTAEDLRADGSVARLPWGRQPVGSIVVEAGYCFVQIMSSEVPSFTQGNAPVGDQMKAALLSTYIAYSGSCTVDQSEGSVTLKVEAAWRPDYVGTEQKRFFRVEGNKMYFGPAPGSVRAGTERLTRRLTLERAQPD